MFRPQLIRALQRLPERAASNTTVTRRCLSATTTLRKGRFGEMGGRWVDPDPQIGDYPNLPHVTAQEKEPFGWDDMQDRRNFGDPIQEQDEVLAAWAPTLHPGNTRTVLRDWSVFVAFIGLLSGFVYATYPEPHFEPRALPFDGMRVELGGNPNDSSDRRLGGTSHADLVSSDLADED
ncbi:hypothetical protein H4R34_002107 [Dimargaris verticillata]|uniref:Uncharacterized protein n=1 Tax=Dimargaris verticillata TaxID=2761393 RepID=A0A9W8E9L9_9FUNG|nr:hypothetical protein H4R34_002107 [Dimargaris verticillata]